MLKKNEKFIKLDYKNLFIGFVIEEDIMKYRKITHCFRHATNEAMKERKKYSEEQNIFLIKYGINIAE